MNNLQTKPHLVQGLGLFDATMIVAGSMIGSGIFIVSADMARQVGCAGWLLSVWALSGVLTIIAALSYGELAAMFPRAGGQYVFLREAYNPLFGFLYGWALFMVIQTGTIAAVASAFARFVGVLFPIVSEQHKFFQIGRFSLSPATIVAILIIWLLTYSNCKGLKTGKTVQNIFTFTKIAALVGLIIAGLLIGANSRAIELNFSNLWSASIVKTTASGEAVQIPHSWMTLVMAVGVSMVGSLFSSDAWNNVTFTAAEVRSPSKNLPLSLLVGVAIVTALYFLANIAYLVTLPLKGSPAAADDFGRGIQFATNDRVATAAARIMFGEAGGAVMAVFIMISTFGCMNGMILAGARVYYAMALDGLFFRKVAELNSNSAPQNGLIFQAVWSSFLVLSGAYSDLLDYVIFAVLIFYIATIVGLFILRKKRPDVERPYKTLGYPLLPSLYIIAASLISIILLISPKTSHNTVPGLIIVLTGIPIYYLWKKFSNVKK
ncbi:MAG: APC family permease [Verrucomicrobiia bacterium]|jgi:APA family basic amino acid/polyamine antiporter